MLATIYVVDSTTEAMQIYEQILGKAGYAVTTQVYAAGILDHIRCAQPDLIILDFALDNEHPGWMTVQLLKMSKDLAHIPILICAAPSQQLENIYAHLISKHIGLLYEPFAAANLLAAVRWLLGEADSPHLDATTPDSDPE